MSRAPRRTTNQVAKGLIVAHLNGEDFAATELDLSPTEAAEWVRLRTDPRRFAPSIFVGSWADATMHPEAGDLRIVRVMTGPDRVTRAIARQGKYLYAFPWM